MKTLYCDASFDWKYTKDNKENTVRGKICVHDGDKWFEVNKVAVGVVPGLKQYINILELTAIARAVELASEMKDESGEKLKSLRVLTDSNVAKIWARSGKVNPKIANAAHANALEYLSTAKKLFGGVVTFDNIPRDHNPAGHILANELLKEKPHNL